MAVRKVQSFICIVDESGNPIGLGGSGGMFVQGPVADGVASTANPVITGGVDGSSNAQTHLVDTSGRHVVVGAVADGIAVAGNPVRVAAKDVGGLTQDVFCDSTGRLIVVGAAAEGAAATGNILLMGGKDGSLNAQPLYVTLQNSDTFGQNAAFGVVCNAMGYVYNSATAVFERTRSANSVDTGTGTGLLGVGPLTFDGTTYNKVRGNLDTTVLSSAARTATTNSSDQTNHNGRGVYVFLNVTINPGGAETLALNIQVKDPVSGTYLTVYTMAATAIFAGGATGMETFMIYPGISEAAAIANSAPQPIAMPKTWRVSVTHSAAGSWTYSVGGAVIN